jgi:hypothetical protein
MQRIVFAGLLMSGLAACTGSDARDTAAKEAAAKPPVMLATGTASTLAAGTTVQATIQDAISSTTSTTGQPVKAIVTLNVVDGAGHIVIPGGSSILLTIAQLRAATSAGDGVILLAIKSVVVGDSTYAPAASVGAVSHTMKAGVAADTNREVIATPGTPITIKLTQPLRISAI